MIGVAAVETDLRGRSAWLTESGVHRRSRAATPLRRQDPLAGRANEAEAPTAGNEKGETTMSPDLKMLVWAVALTLVQGFIAVLGAMSRVGLPALAGNRDNLPRVSGWPDRAARAHRNMLESLVLFAALVLVAQVTGKANATTALGAQVFFWARLVYVPVYVVGIPWVRTAVWGVSIFGLVQIFFQLV